MGDEKNELSTEVAVAAAAAASGSDAEEFAEKIMARAASLTGVKIDRGSFLRTELK